MKALGLLQCTILSKGGDFKGLKIALSRGGNAESMKLAPVFLIWPSKLS
jgi:hypothetical protein